MSNKTLVITRHAKSSWDYESIDDFDRPLKESGIRNAYLVAETLKKKQITFDKIYSSPANRALHTAVIFSGVLKVPFNNIQINEQLYSEYDSEVLQFIKSLPDNISKVLIVGHNPTFTDLANRFLKQRISNLPTAGAVYLELNCESWSQAGPVTVVKDSLFFPKKIGDSND
ncbi:MAG TPA: histidine phosphatase family protein [Bacteroidales bacterium]|nr:histidine phosphatase family protein [Bacteroidales bacterium]